ncbi:MAG: DNA repair exonuclease [Leptolyngbyaceae cyanobacterium bins.59]|nr:DNA repair exonuclease [Leptolyngbyaceae cyanobacterium bins.59]
MPRFLHLSDVHLGLDRYGSPERTRDFFEAFKDALKKYAIDAAVDFVLIVGDLFDDRNLLPPTLNQAQVCLQMLQEAGIPVLAIEGNHDNHPYGTETSWLRYLAEWGYLILLEPQEDARDETLIYEPWTPETRRGGYIDLDCGVRVLGSRWYGPAAPRAIERLAVGIRHLPPDPPYTVMMFHHGLKDQIARYTGALDYKDLLPLRQAGVDYLALGHIHKNYAVEGWVFNAGSVEANSIAENQQQTPRGVYLVELSPGEIQADLKQDYYQRPIFRLSLEAHKDQTEEDLIQAALTHIQAKNQSGQFRDALVELRIQGQVGFNRLNLNLRELESQLKQLTEALVFRLRYEVKGTEYETPIVFPGPWPPPRSAIETQVFTDLLAAHSAYCEQATQLTPGLMELKDKILEQESDAELYQRVQELLRVSKI